MTRKIETKHLFLVATLFLITALASLPVAAWGPYAQAVIAEGAAEALGSPKGTGTPDFVDTVVTPKGFEYTDRAYVKLDPAFTMTMNKLGGSGPGLTQVLAWGTAQVSEATGDRGLFDSAESPWERWLLELMVDASLMHGAWEPDYSHILRSQGVACRTALLAGTTKVYCQNRKGKAPFSSIYACQRAELRALAMLADQVIIADEQFQANSFRLAPPYLYSEALNDSVAAAVSFIVFGHGEPNPGGIVPRSISDAPLQLMGKLGSILIANDDAFVGFTETDGVARFSIGILTERCNSIARTFLQDTADNVDEDPTMRLLAEMLVAAMSPDFQTQ